MVHLLGALDVRFEGQLLFHGGNVDEGDGMWMIFFFEDLLPRNLNMEPENDGFQKESPFPGTSFQVPC